MTSEKACRRCIVAAFSGDELARKTTRFERNLAMQPYEQVNAGWIPTTVTS